MVARRFLLLCCLALGLANGMVSKAVAGGIAEVSPVRVLIDVRSKHSDGSYTMEELIHLAERRGIDALAFTEHDRFSIRFGIEPIANILGYSMQHPSLYTSGLDNFFSALRAQRLQHPEIQLFAGTESMPGYTWSGIPFKNLTLHNAERHLITLGIERAEQVEGLSSYDLRNAHGPVGISLFFWSTLFVIMMVVFIRHQQRKSALLLIIIFVGFLVLWFAKNKHDMDADFIQSAHQQGLLVIWAHPGTLSGVRDGPMGIKLNTPPYNQRVFESAAADMTADAFAAVYGESDQNTDAGGLWDRYMMAYMLGVQVKPIWAVAAGDYHEEGMAGEYLGNFPMDVWTKSKKPSSILLAMKQGHMAAWGLKKDQNIALKTLYLEDADGQRLLAGDEADVRAPLHVVVELKRTVQRSEAAVSFQGEWIVDGKLVQSMALLVGSKRQSSLNLAVKKGVHVIRLQIKQGVRLLANPFLVHVQ